MRLETEVFQCIGAGRSSEGLVMSGTDIIASCQHHLAGHPNDCSGFVRAVAGDCGVLLTGDANWIVFLLGTGVRLHDGAAARQAAAAGQLVIGGLEAPRHGHVVVVVDGPLNRGRYPYAFWGRYRGFAAQGMSMNVGFTQGHGTVNYAFDVHDRDLVKYAAFQPSLTTMRRARESEGRLVYTFQ
jgi:hypothetical protein